jgi:hypothetical protein
MLKLYENSEYHTPEFLTYTGQIALSETKGTKQVYLDQVGSNNILSICLDERNFNCIKSIKE